MQFSVQQFGFTMLVVHVQQQVEPLEPFLRRLIGFDFCECGRKIGMRLNAPCLFQKPCGVLFATVFNVSTGGHCCSRDKIGRILVRGDRCLAGLDRVSVLKNGFRLGQSQNSVATLVNVTRQRAVLEFGVQRFTRAGPITALRLQRQQRVLNFFVLRFDGKGAFRQLQGCVGVTISKALFHHAANTDKTGRVMFEQALVHVFCLLAVTSHFGRLCGQKIGQFGLVKIPLGLLGLRHRLTTFTRGERCQTFGQSRVTFAFTVAVEIPRNGCFVAVDEVQYGDQQSDQFEQHPSGKQKDDSRNYGLKRSEGVFNTCDGHLNTAG